MAAFRAITGEEESATAIFRALVRRGYHNAERLSRRKHEHKAAVRPFLRAVAQTLKPLPTVEEKLNIVFDEEAGQLQAKIFLPIEVDQEVRWLHSEHPFEFVMLDENGAIRFSPEIDRIVNDNNAFCIIEHVRKLANERNRVLYASDTGITRVKLPIDNALLRQRNAIFTNLLIFHLIDNHPQQMFVQHCLDAFLEMLNLLPTTEQTA